MQHEITRPIPLLDENGMLTEPGFAKRPNFRYNPENIRLTPLAAVNRLRLKEWDYYGVTGPDWFFSVAVSHAGLAGVAFAYFIDFKTLAMPEATVITPLGMGVTLPRDSRTGDIAFRWGRVNIEFKRLPNERRLRVDWPRLSDGRPLVADLVLAQPESIESIVMATPIGARGFYHNEKINCLPAMGEIRLGDTRLVVEPDRALGDLDWGRGVWDYHTFWNWGTASGFLPDGGLIGLNLGKGFGDLSAATENCFFLDGKMHKLGWVDFEYDAGDYMKPWRFRADDGRLDLTLTPIFDRHDKTDLLVIRTEVHQMFGRYSGTLVTDEGKKLEIRDLLGWAEEHRARW